MEGLIPFVFNAMKKQRPQNAYRSLSNSSSGRSYHLLLSTDSVDGGSSHRRTRSDFAAQPSNVGTFLSGNSEQLAGHQTNFASAAAPSAARNGMRHRGFTSADHYQVSAPSNVAYGR